MQLAGGQLISFVRMVVLAQLVAPGAFGLVAGAAAVPSRSRAGELLLLLPIPFLGMFGVVGAADG